MKLLCKLSLDEGCISFLSSFETLLLANCLGTLKDKTVKRKTGKFSIRDNLTKMKNKNERYEYLCLLNNLPKVKIALVKQASDH